jgi:putative membrane protein
MIKENELKDDARIRDHLANERTFLAWLRTGVAAMGLGVVIAKLRYILGTNYPESSGIVHAANIGLIFALAGISTIVFSAFFFLQIRSQIRTGNYVSKTKLVLVLAIVMVGLGLIILWYLIQPTVRHE